MNENELFQAALGLLPPWQVDRCTFDKATGRLDIIWIFLVAVSLPALFAGFCARPTTRANGNGGT